MQSTENRYNRNKGLRNEPETFVANGVADR